MSKEPDRKQHEKNYILTFFKKWKASLQKQISEGILSLVCIVCCDNLVYKRNEARLSGIEKEW